VEPALTKIFVVAAEEGLTPTLATTSLKTPFA